MEAICRGADRLGRHCIPCGERRGFDRDRLGLGSGRLKVLLKISAAIDAMNEKFGVIANYLVLFAALISAGNAGSRYLFSESSNGWLEIQWYMFAGMVLLGAPYTLKMNEHVRVDLVYGMVSERTRIWIDIVGGVAVSAADLRHPHLFHLAVVRQLLEYQRSVVERRRAGPLAGEVAVAGRIFPDGAARRFGNHQTHRRA